MSGNEAKIPDGAAIRLDPCWPVLPGPRYRGLVWNHPKIGDGTLITTSAIVELKDGRIVTCSGSAYQLGRTFYSEQHAMDQAGGLPGLRAHRAPEGLRVIDLESEDLSALGTFAHERICDIEG
jgi:hypothetical protein